MALTKVQSGVLAADILKVINSATALSAAPAVGDELPVYDISASAEKKITVAELYEAITRLTTLGAASNAADELAIYDASASVVRKVTMAQALGAIDTLADLAATPDVANDKLLVWDNSASVVKFINPNRLPLFKSYTSAEQTITQAGALTLAHGLSVVPELVQLRLVNKITQHNYSVNDIVIISSDNRPSTTEGASVVIDATNVDIRFANSASVFSIFNKTTGALQSITPASWRLIVKAWV